MATGSCDPVSRRAPRQHLPTTIQTHFQATPNIVCPTIFTCKHWEFVAGTLTVDHHQVFLKVSRDGNVVGWLGLLNLFNLLLQLAHSSSPQSGQWSFSSAGPLCLSHQHHQWPDPCGLSLQLPLPSLGQSAGTSGGEPGFGNQMFPNNHDGCGYGGSPGFQKATG